MIFPDGAMELILNLGDPQKLCRRENQEETFFKRSWISGERAAPIVIEETGEVHLVGARFKPGGAYPFFRFPVSELTGRVVELDAIWGGELERLREQLAEAPDAQTVFARLEQWLQNRRSSHMQPSRSVAFALARIQRGGDEARIGRIVEMTGISHKHLTREFDRWVGLTPKLLARIFAFQSAIA